MRTEDIWTEVWGPARDRYRRHRGGCVRLHIRLLLLPRQLLDALPHQGALRAFVSGRRDSVLELRRCGRAAAGGQSEHADVLSRQHPLSVPARPRGVQSALSDSSRRSFFHHPRAHAVELRGGALRDEWHRDLGDGVLQPDRRRGDDSARVSGGLQTFAAPPGDRVRPACARRRAGHDPRRGPVDRDPRARPRSDPFLAARGCDHVRRRLTATDRVRGDRAGSRAERGDVVPHGAQRFAASDSHSGVIRRSGHRSAERSRRTIPCASVLDDLSRLHRRAGVVSPLASCRRRRGDAVLRAGPVQSGHRGTRGRVAIDPHRPLSREVRVADDRGHRRPGR